MRNTGLRYPAVNALICFAMFVGGAVSVWSGAAEMNALGYETSSSSLKIGLGLFVGIVGFLFQFNFLWGVRVMRAMRRGEGEIARWTVSPDALDAFRKNEERRKALGDRNDYKLPARNPSGGLQVIFAADGVLVGDTYFGLASTGLSYFRSVQVLPENPLCIEFGTALVSGSNLSVPRLYTATGVLRIPVSRTATAQAKKVLAHFAKVLARETVVKPDFWRRRVRWGLTAAVVCALAAGAGFALEAAEVQLGIVPLIMAVAGTIFGVGGLILASIAWMFHLRQDGGTRRRLK